MFSSRKEVLRTGGFVWVPEPLSAKRMRLVTEVELGQLLPHLR
jgi:hypothetical protein